MQTLIKKKTEVNKTNIEFKPINGKKKLNNQAIKYLFL